jgi:hypothetical protein
MRADILDVLREKSNISELALNEPLSNSLERSNVCFGRAGRELQVYSFSVYPAELKSF